REVSSLLLESIAYGLAHREEALGYALGFARGIPREEADRFVGMYVNEFILDYGPRGRAGVRELLRRAHGAGLLPEAVEPEFAP
ncbi:MAG: MqnA/MqnD/SBP family protein, partial [Nitrospinota bacterium]